MPWLFLGEVGRMVRCVYCPKFRREDCMCYRDPEHPRKIRSSDIYKDLKCDGFPNFGRLNWLRNAQKRQQNPSLKARLSYQMLKGEVKPK